MSKRSAQPGDIGADPLPPIPDGGLGTVMPDWLRRPPAWQDLRTAPVTPGDVPHPETSPIDPRTILTAEDLPDWLKRIAADHAAPVSGLPDEEVLSSGGHEPNMTPSNAADEVRPASRGLGVRPSLRVGASETSDDPVPLVIEPTDHSAMNQWFRLHTLTAVLCVCLVLGMLIIILYVMDVV